MKDSSSIRFTALRQFYFYIVLDIGFDAVEHLVAVTATAGGP